MLDFYLGGLILCGFANLFLFQMSPENWNIGLSGIITVVARIIAWLLVCSFCAIAYALLGFFLGNIRKTTGRIIALPLLFPAMELVRSYLYAAISYGPKGSFSPNYNWGSLAVPGAGTVLVYNSRILGFFGISFAVVLCNVIIFLIIQRKLYAATMLASLMAICTVIGWKMGNVKATARVINVSVVHIGETEFMKDTDTSITPPPNTDLLVLSEYSGIEKNAAIQDYLRNLNKNGVAVTTVVNGKSPKGTNRIIYISKTGEVINRQDKTFLIPTGEFLPYSLQASFKTIGRSSINEAFKYTQQLERGDKPEKVFTTKDNIAIGTLACSGVSALNEYKRLTDEGADILVNSASLAFIEPNSLYHVYAKNMARFQAVSNNRPFAQASRSGRSYIIDNQGRTLVVSKGQNKQILSAPVKIR